MALSPEEFTKLKTQLQGRSGGSQALGKKSPSILENLAEAGQGFTSGVSESLNKRGEQLNETLSSDINPAVKGIDIVGKGAAFANDIAGETIKAGITAAGAKPAVKTAIAATLSTPVGQLGLQALQAGDEAFKRFKEVHPETAIVLADLFSIAETIAPAKGASVANKGVQTAAKGAMEATDTITDGIKAVASKASDVITPIDDATASVLNPTRLIPKEKLKDVPFERIVAQAEDKAQKFDSYLNEARKAVQDYSKPSALAKAGNKGSEALTVLQNKLNKQAQLKNEALGRVGDKTIANIQVYRDFFAQQLADKVGVRILDDANEILTDIVKKGDGITNAVGRKSKIAFDPADNKLIKDTNRILKELGDSPTVRELDDTVDALQDLLYKRKTLTAVPVNGQVEAILKQMTGKLNSAVKKIGGEQYTKANAKYAYYIDVFEKLNKALGAEGVRGASLMKQLFSPSGEAPRRLFEEIKKLTGIDLVEEATLAKFAMEHVGDARQASMLEEIIRGQVLGPTSFVGKAAEKILGNLTDPVGKAKRIIKSPTKN